MQLMETVNLEKEMNITATSILRKDLISTKINQHKS